MSAHVAHADRPAAAPEGHPLRAVPPAPPRPPRLREAAPEKARRRAGPSRARASRDRGMSLLYVFTGATVIMVGDVVLAGSVGHMWILVPVMAIHLLMTFGVFAAIMHLLADEGEGEVPDEA